MKRRDAIAGFTLIELLVSVSIFGIIGVGIISYIVETYRRLGLEVRAAVASQELNSAVQLLSSEVRMGASISPYITGIDPSLVNCSGAIAATADTLRFLVVHDDATSASGISAYYVGYLYDPATKILYRGEVPAPSVTACTLPAGDPLANGTRQVLATRVVRVDTTGDGAVEQIFNLSSPTLALNIGIEVDGPGGTSITQRVSNTIFTRAS